jgi:prolyl-tRNA synthetase
VRNAYFPCFVSKKALEAEADFVEGFSPEVAWITKAGQTEMKEPIAMRPTSETIMYPMYAKWIRSHRDLPLKLNQWCNVVRWEFKRPVPFLRAREFLWQEGHSAFATTKEADEEVLQILDLYRQVYNDLLAIPVVLGRKTDKEKFAGGLYTTTCEAFIEPNGRAIQAATSHCLGDHFAKAFNIEFENEQGKKELVIQNSWGLSTRSLGVMIMVHGDDKGLRLPPRVAPVQVVIVPIYSKTNYDVVTAKAHELSKVLSDAGIRVEGDYRQNYKPGWKFNHWETKGVPIRLEIGERDIASGNVVLVRRDTGAKSTGSFTDLVATVKTLLDSIHTSMYNAAKAVLDARKKRADTYDDFIKELNQRNIVLVPFCCTHDCEDKVKARTGADTKAMASDENFGLTGSAKSLCIPFDQPQMPAGQQCFAGCGSAAVSYTLFGRSY